jgi:hypothetical protein
MTELVAAQIYSACILFSMNVATCLLYWPFQSRDRSESSTLAKAILVPPAFLSVILVICSQRPTHSLTASYDEGTAV